MKVISLSLNPKVTAALILLWFLFTKNKLIIWNFLFYVCTLSYFISLLKLVFHDPRPYMVNSDLEPLE